jgi:hypothetical protein
LQRDFNFIISSKNIFNFANTTRDFSFANTNKFVCCTSNNKKNSTLPTIAKIFQFCKHNNEILTLPIKKKRKEKKSHKQHKNQEAMSYLKLRNTKLKLGRR